MSPIDVEKAKLDGHSSEFEPGGRSTLERHEDIHHVMIRLLASPGLRENRPAHRFVTEALRSS